jgi:ribonucleoside-diphosphate reductase alpha chain|tara:strand:- start:4274 stop:5917 length:1644 start_codon:yes stop_codon:yes gene_type:complete
MEDYYWLNEDSRVFLERGYLKEETPEERIKSISDAAQGYLGIEGFSDKFAAYMKQGFYSLASPVWSNFGRKSGLPISCNGVYVPDRMDGILAKQGEVGMQTKHGSGTSAYFGDLRGRGEKINSGGESSGAVHFMELFDKVAAVVSQGNVRRGSFAAYLPIEHSDIKEFLRIRSEGNAIQEMSFGVTVGDDWMKSMIAGDPDKRQIWASLIKKRFETGYPYLFFKDAANNQAPDCYKDNGMEIYASNLCNEISLPSTEDESFVCCLSSLNLVRWDEIIKTDAVETMTMFLDAVMEEYIQKTEDIPFMKPSHNFAKRHRALGMGVLGWHSYLQSKKIGFESMEAKLANSSIFKEIRKRSDKATEELFGILGGPLYAKDYNRRNTTTLAIAPTTSSSFILGQVSPSIEPLNSNYFVKNLAKGKFTYRNPYLKEVLSEYGKDSDEIWLSILVAGGSVQHLNFMSDDDKEVFKTFGEISQKEIVIQAAQRQKYLDQGQSLNLMIAPKTPLKEVNQLMIYAWENGLKGLYYQRSSNPSQELSRSLMECKSCEA